MPSCARCAVLGPLASCTRDASRTSVCMACWPLPSGVDTGILWSPELLGNGQQAAQPLCSAQTGGGGGGGGGRGVPAQVPQVTLPSVLDLSRPTLFQVQQWQQTAMGSTASRSAPGQGGWAQAIVPTQAGISGLEFYVTDAPGPSAGSGHAPAAPAVSPVGWHAPFRERWVMVLLLGNHVASVDFKDSAMHIWPPGAASRVRCMAPSLENDTGRL